MYGVQGLRIFANVVLLNCNEVDPLGGQFPQHSLFLNAGKHIKEITLFVESSELAEFLHDGIAKCGGGRGGLPSTLNYLGRTETVRFQFMEALLFGKENCLEEASIEAAHFAVKGVSVTKDGHTRGVTRPVHPIKLHRFLGVTREFNVEKIGVGAAFIACQPWSRRD
eukprot:6213765-Pleurochrysis_carterae.AAC.1